MKMSATDLAHDVLDALVSGDSEQFAWGQQTLVAMAQLLDRRQVDDAPICDEVVIDDDADLPAGCSYVFSEAAGELVPQTEWKLFAAGEPEPQ
jgi:hypothetical protein